MRRLRTGRLKYLSITKLEGIKANNYMRASFPFGRFDPEEVDRELRKKKNNAAKITLKHKGTL